MCGRFEIMESFLYALLPHLYRSQLHTEPGICFYNSLKNKARNQEQIDQLIAAAQLMMSSEESSAIPLRDDENEVTSVVRGRLCFN